MNRDELQNKICDLITDATVDPSGESIIATTKEIMNLVDEYEHNHEHVEFVKPTRFLFRFKTIKNNILVKRFNLYAIGKTREEAEEKAKLEVYKLSKVWPDKVILLECKELDQNKKEK